MNATDTCSITALVPIYNEIATLKSSIPEIHKFLTSLGQPFEILIVESGSSDGSAMACDALAARFSELVVIHEETRNGFGAALRLGFTKARMDFIWVIPVDQPYPLSTLTHAIPQMQTCDAVLSVRTGDERSIVRRIQSYVYTMLASFLLRQPAHSPNAAFKLYRRTLLQSLPLSSNGWFLDTEIAYRLRERNCPLGTVGILTTERQTGKSTVTPCDSWRMLKQLLAFRRRLADEKKHR